MSKTYSTPTLPSGSPQSQVRALYDMVMILWRKNIENENTIQKLVSLLQPELSIKRILELLRKINEHSSVMPDQFGVNTDHDKRYLTREEFNSFLRGEIVATAISLGIWKFEPDGVNLDLRYDKNLGVGDADFTGDPYDHMTPE